MDNRELADLSARLYCVQNGIPLNIALTLDDDTLMKWMEVFARLNGDWEDDGEDPFERPPPKLTVIDFAAARAKLDKPE